jgi:hypothetical protein
MTKDGMEKEKEGRKMNEESCDMRITQSSHSNQSTNQQALNFLRTMTVPKRTIGMGFNLVEH